MKYLVYSDIFFKVCYTIIRMTEIKSAFEKAMERFQDVQPNKHSLLRKEIKDKGRLLCAHVLEDSTIDIQGEIEKHPSEEQDWIKEGIGETLIGQIALPSDATVLERINIINSIAMKLSSNPAVVEQLMKQFKQICEQYLNERNKITEQMQIQLEQMQKQYSSADSAQQQSIQAKLAQAVREQLKEMEEHFQPAVNKVRANMRQLCGFSLEK